MLTTMKTYDVFTYNGEREILNLHLSILDKHIDKFIIVEANKTFSGFDKPMYFFQQQRYFKKWWPKIDYYVVNKWDDPQIWDLALNSPNTKGADHWKREFYIKESIHKALKASHVQDDDLLFIGDVDEIIDPDSEFESDTPVKAKLRVYTYYLNNESNEEFHGTLMARYGDIKDKCLNHLRSDTSLYSNGPYLGWHFTSQGGIKELQRKLNDSYTTETYNTMAVQQNLPENYKNRKDFLGRDFQFKVSEENWPQYLKDHKKDYKHLCL